MSGRFGRSLAMLLVLSLAGASLIFLAYMLDEAARHGFELVIAGLIGLGGMGFLMLRGPVGKALADMLTGAGGSDPMMAQRLADLEARLADIEHRGLGSGEVEQAYARLAEVEERLEFTERLLAQPRIGEGRHGA